MAINLGSAETAARENEADKASERQDGTVDRARNVPPRLYIIHNADAANAASNKTMNRAPYPWVRSQGMVDRTLQAQIGRMLRDVFSDVAEEAVPERFIRLLEALEAKEKQP